MPANPKYLTQSPLHRFLKITAGFVGGWVITQLLHAVSAHWIDPVYTVNTLRYAGFMIWCTLLILAFLSKNGWRIWGIYIGIIIALLLLVELSETINPLA